jgi:hypothetical protein
VPPAVSGEVLRMQAHDQPSPSATMHPLPPGARAFSEATAAESDSMKIPTIVGLLALGTMLPLASGSAQTPAQDAIAAMQGVLAARVVDGCREELVQYCSEVTPGEARLLACLYAHGDKLSGECQFQLYDASVRLERAINRITYVAAQCGPEIQAHCANVEPGEGRMVQCLRDNQSALRPGCDEALTEVGVQ